MWVLLSLRNLILLSLAIVSVSANAQITVSGKVANTYNGEDLYFADVFLEDRSVSTVTNQYGYFSLDIDSSKVLATEINIIISYIGFDNDTVTVATSSSTRITVRLTPSAELMQEVVVSAEADRHKEMVSSTEVGTIHMRMAEFKHLPTIAGEKDVIKSMQLLPGISGGTEGSTDFFVRGGDGDQNLVLLDEATVYNVGAPLRLFLRVQLRCAPRCHTV